MLRNWNSAGGRQTRSHHLPPLCGSGDCRTSGRSCAGIAGCGNPTELVQMAGGEIALSFGLSGCLRPKGNSAIVPPQKEEY